MNRGPRRLKEDPDFQWETGCDLADEMLTVGEYNLPAMKASLLASVAAQPPVTVGDGVPSVRSGGSAWVGAKPLGGVVIGAAIVAGAYWLGTQASLEPAPIEVAPEVEAVEVAPAVRGIEATAARPEPVVPVAPAKEAPSRVEGGVEDPVASVAPVARVVPSAPEATGTADVADGGEALAEAAPATLDRVDVPVPVVASPSSSLPEQLTMYDPAADALLNGRYDEAISGFRSYLDAWPDGAMRREAQLGLLHSLFGVGDAEGTEALAANLQRRPEFSTHRQDILRLQADALVVLGRCDEAMALADSLPPKGAAQVRRACRLLRRQ